MTDELDCAPHWLRYYYWEVTLLREGPPGLLCSDKSLTTLHLGRFSGLFRQWTTLGKEIMSPSLPKSNLLAPRFKSAGTRSSVLQHKPETQTTAHANVPASRPIPITLRGNHGEHQTLWLLLLLWVLKFFISYSCLPSAAGKYNSLQEGWNLRPLTD